MILIVEASLVYFVNASESVARQVILSIPCAAMVSNEVRTVTSEIVAAE